MQDREHAVHDPAQDTGTVIGEDSAVGGTPTSGAHGDTGADPGAPGAGPGSGAGADLEDLVAAMAPAADATAADTPAANTTAADATGAPAPADPAELDRVRAELAERTADLQRVSAEYANYRRRTDRDREGTVAGAKAQIASELLLVLDDVDRAASHGDLTGAFKAVADRLGDTLSRAGLTSFGVEGDPFDPAVHEAVAHETSAGVTGPTVSTVMRRGYRFADRVLRPAMVAVTDADPDAPTAPAGAGATGSPAATNPDAG